MNIVMNMMSARLSASQSISRLELGVADLQADLARRPLADQEHDQAQQHADDADQQEPEPEIEHALDDPAVLEPDRVLRTFVLQIGGPEEGPAEIDEQKRVGNRKQHAAEELDPRPGAEPEVLGVGVDAGM